MRLVDLDSNDFENHLETGREEFARGVRFVWDTLNNLPIVEAIPISWIKEKACRFDSETKDLIETLCFRYVLNAWREENEQEQSSGV